MNADQPLQTALGRIGSDAISKGTYSEFGDQKRLAGLLAKDKADWVGLSGVGGASFLQGSANAAEQLGLDLSAAAYAIAIGFPPATVTLIAGGQNGETVRSAAEPLGYKGDDVLSQKLNVGEPITVSVSQIRPMGEDVALGSADADMTLVDAKGDSLLEMPEIETVGGCRSD